MAKAAIVMQPPNLPLWFAVQAQAVPRCVGFARSASFGITSLQPGSGPSAFDFVSASRFLLVPTTQVFLIIPDADSGLLAVVF